MEPIPLTYFDYRQFPPIQEEEKIDFILHTNLLEQEQLTEDEVKGSVLIPERANPLVSGQSRALTLIGNLAREPNLIPKRFRDPPAWLQSLHKNIFYELAKKGEKLLNSQDYPSLFEVGAFRQEDKVLGERRMPSPYRIKPLLTQAFQEYSNAYAQLSSNLSSPMLMSKEDWKTIEEATYTINLRICCIKPFKDGSNRVARLTENLLRLNAGLKFKVISNKDKLLRDIHTLQDTEYSNLD